MIQIAYGEWVAFSKPEIDTSKSLRAADSFWVDVSARKGCSNHWQSVGMLIFKNLDSGWSITYDLTSCDKFPLGQDTSQIRQIPEEMTQDVDQDVFVSIFLGR